MYVRCSDPGFGLGRTLVGNHPGPSRDSKTAVDGPIPRDAPVTRTVRAVHVVAIEDACLLASGQRIAQEIDRIAKAIALLQSGLHP